MNKEIILDTDSNLVEYKTDIKGWVGKDGRFYGKEKDLAIYANSTHKKCDKGHIFKKSWISCPDCRELELPEKYLRLKEIEWNKETPLCLFDTDTYFWNIDEIYDYAECEEIDIKNLDLVICEPQHLWRIETDIWEDIIPEDMDLNDYASDEFIEKLKELNNIIDNHKPISWIGGKFRTRVTRLNAPG